MIVLSKKRIVFIISVLIISFAFIVVNGDVYGESDSITVADENIGYTVILDAGHGQPDGGAENSDGLSEEEINLNIVLKLQELLEQSGYTIILTRSDENGIYDLDSSTLKSKKVSDLKNRVELANSEEADIFVSIHLNKIEQSQYYGWQTFYQEGNEDSERLADSIQNNLNYTIQKENKREILSLTGKYIMDNVEIPTVTVECGFLSNEEEAAELATDEYQSELAWGIYTGIVEYFE